LPLLRLDTQAGPDTEPLRHWQADGQAVRLIC
jgi:hypothetical protein